LIASGVILSFWLPDRDPVGHLSGGVAGFVVLYTIAVLYRRARAREGLGLGDAKLAAAAGAWLGWQVLPLVVLVASVGGLVWLAVAMCFRGRAALKDQVPFGVPLCLSFWLEWIWLYGAPF
jgi:leader peptidase (prepilin peptidase)/N-methyltransferase